MGELMAHIDKFLGKRVEVPEDRNYVTKQGLRAGGVSGICKAVYTGIGDQEL